MTIREIVADWLKSHGYDGLYCGEVGDECGCHLDDFAPCGNQYNGPDWNRPDSCVPGYRHTDGHMYAAKEAS
jgi:hypothetical protein